MGKALDRLDRAAAEDRSKALRIPLNRLTAPEIFEADSNEDRELAWHVLDVLQSAGLGSVEMRKAARHGSREERDPVFAVSTDLVSEQAIRAAYGRPRPRPGRAADWRAAVDASDLPESVKSVLRESPVSVRDRLPGEVLSRLLMIRDLHDRNADSMLREVSSRAFWGLSKVLDGRGDLVAALLGEEECPYPEQPIHLDVYFSGAFSWILFIENKTSFERAIRASRSSAGVASPLDGAALVFCSGFMGVARRLRQPSGRRLFYCFDGVSDPASVPGFELALGGEIEAPTAFWGDLDFSGIAILGRLRSSFPNAVAWEPGYAPMLAKLLAGEGHLPDEARKEGQRQPQPTGCSYADDVLLQALLANGCFVDQE